MTTNENQSTEKEYIKRIEYIKTEKGIPTEEIEKLCNEKIEKHPRLSKYGALWEVSKDFGVNLSDVDEVPEMQKLSSLCDKTRINVEVKVVSAFPEQKLESGKIKREFKVFDGESEVKVVCWGGTNETNKLIAQGKRNDLLRIINGYGKHNEYTAPKSGKYINELVLSLGDGTNIEINPKGYRKINDITLPIKETPYLTIKDTISTLKSEFEGRPNKDDKDVIGFGVSIKGVVSSVPKKEIKKNQKGDEFSYFGFTLLDNIESDSPIEVVMYDENCNLKLTNNVDIKNAYAKINRHGIALVIKQDSFIEKI